MKKSITFLNLFIYCSLFAQVGINENVPQATLDIKKHPTSTTPQGILIPRLTGDEIRTMPVNANQNSMLVYATSAATAVSTPPSKTELVNEAGYYFYNHSNHQFTKLLSREAAKVDGTFGSNIDTPITSSSFLNGQITLTPGTWRIDLALFYKLDENNTFASNEFFAIPVTLSESSLSSTSSVDLQENITCLGYIQYPVPEGILNGYFYVKTNTTKTYYLWKLSGNYNDDDYTSGATENDIQINYIPRDREHVFTATKID